MNFEELLNSKKIEIVEKEEFNFELAEKDINSARNSFNSKDYDWAISIAYNAVLRIGRSFMQSLGFRSIGKEHHKNVFEFLREAGFNEELTNYFDNIRKKRNNFVYGIVEGSSSEEAEETLIRAASFVQEIRTFVLKNKTEGKK